MSTVAVEKVGDKARQSVKWFLTLQALQKVFLFVINILLARLLLPADFGLMTMIVTLDMITMIISSMGINAAIIHFQDNVEERINAAFWLFLASMTFFIILQAICAPFIANFYKSPILVDIIRTNAVAMYITCLGSTQRTILAKNIDFKKISILETSITLIRNVMYVTFAWLGFGVWSFIYPKIVTAIFNTASLWVISDWRPKFRFYLKYWFEMFNYGKTVLFANITDYIFNNSSYILIGNLVGSTALGFYTFAYDKSMMLVSILSYSATSITFPVFSRLQDHKNKLVDTYYKTVKLIFLIAFPYSVGQIILAQEYITLVFGSKWHSSIIIFQILLIYSMFRSASQCGASVLQGIGRPGVLLKWNLICIPIFILSLYIGFKAGGIIGIGQATTIMGSLEALTFMAIIQKILRIPVKDIILFLKEPLICSSGMAIVLILLKTYFEYLHFSSIAIIATLIPAGIISYILFLRFMYKDIYEFIIANLARVLGINKFRNSQMDVIPKKS